jgi:osmoprotectant transport system substrate-binding protein
MRKHRKLALGASLLAFAIFSAACGNGSGGGGNSPTVGPSADKGVIAVGVSGPYAENQVVAEMYAQVLENAGYDVVRKLDIESRAVGDTSLGSGEIDVKPEYLAFELTALDSNADAKGVAEDVYPRVQQAAEAKGLKALAFSPANSTNVFVMLPETATSLGVATMSDLGPKSADLIAGTPPDCATNYPCKQGLEEVYGITFKEIKELDFGGNLTVKAIDSGAVDVGELFSLDPIIASKGYTVLEDDKSLQPAGNFFALIREEKETPEVEELLNAVTTSLENEAMVEMIGRIQIEHEDVADVAREYLQNQGLL